MRKTRATLARLRHGDMSDGVGLESVLDREKGERLGDSGTRDERIVLVPVLGVADAADVEGVTQAVAEEIQAEDREHDRQPRKDTDPPGLADEIASLV